MTVQHLSILLVLIGNFIRLWRMLNHINRERAKRNKFPVGWKWLFKNRRKKLGFSFFVSIVAGWLLYTATDPHALEVAEKNIELAAVWAGMILVGMLGDKCIDVAEGHYAKKYGVNVSDAVEIEDDGNTEFYKK